MGKELLVASIYGPSELNAKWYALQKSYLQRTTTVPFDFKLCLNGSHPGQLSGADVIWQSVENEGHAPALTRLLAHLREQRYPASLILDSDCFPIRRGWHSLLLRQMHELDRQVAAPVRTENLDLFPHPSAFFVLESALDDPRLDFAVTPATGLLGDEISDVGGSMQCMMDRVLPLLRTNVVNVHPIAAGVYHHLFYHHGAGSRDFNFRVLKRYGYYDHWYDRSRQHEHGAKLLKALLRNPDKFIARLTGNRERRIRKFLKRI